MFNDQEKVRTFTGMIRPMKPLLRSLAKHMPLSVVRRLSPQMINRHSYLFGVYCPQFPSFHSKMVLLRADDWAAIDVDARGIASHGGETVELFAQLLRHAGTVLDVGSHTGLYAIMAGVQNRRRSVYAFEPAPKTFARLERNIALNRVGHVHALPYAVTDHDGKIELFIPKGDLPTEASTLPGFRVPAQTLSVPAVTLDTVLAEHRLGTVDLMKIDTEGTEHHVLHGARRCLERDRPVIICEVLRGLTEPALHEALDPLGYSYFWITRDGLVRRPKIEGDPDFQYLNYLMLTEDRAAHFLREVPHR